MLIAIDWTLHCSATKEEEWKRLRRKIEDAIGFLQEIGQWKEYRKNSKAKMMVEEMTFGRDGGVIYGWKCSELAQGELFVPWQLLVKRCAQKNMNIEAVIFPSCNCLLQQLEISIWRENASSLPSVEHWSKFPAFMVCLRSGVDFTEDH